MARKRVKLGLGFAVSAALFWAGAVHAQEAAPSSAEARESNPLEAMLGLWINPYGAHNMREPDDPRLKLPPVTPPKLTPEYAAKTKAVEDSWVQADQNGVEGASPQDFTVRRQLICIPYGLPRTMTRNMSIDILDGGNHITIVGELDREIRRIWLDRDEKPLEDINPGYWGYSVGHWEGDVLVVKTTGIKAEIFGEEWMAHSDHMVLEERIYLKEPGILYDEITITDPEALLEPFKVAALYVRAPKEFEPVEFVCDELPTYKIGPDGLLTIDTSSVE